MVNTRCHKHYSLPLPVPLFLSPDSFVSKCSTSFNMFLEFSGFLLCRQCDPMRWSPRPELVRGLILSAWQWIAELLDCWTARLLDCWIVRSAFSGSQLPLLLALIWRHCHRYKTSFVCPLDWSRHRHWHPLRIFRILCALLPLLLPLGRTPIQMWSGSVTLLFSLGCLVLGLWTLVLSTCVHQHLVSREIHSRLVII